ncbi:galactokinase [Rhipicephalus sanguineus]|uniref:galactokinase n=1 Tax=Rhipicephalus sanguineus TaxID=34632 RepID=UPI001895E33E|nr:galactokinase [Rhipicephalus sanguineus]
MAASSGAYPSVGELALRALSKYRSEFGSEPAFYGSAPGRVNLIGEHVDYCEGLVLPCAMPLYTVVVGSPVVGSSVCNVHSLDYPEPASFQLPTEESPLKPGEPSWSNYVRGVVAHFPGKSLALEHVPLNLTSAVILVTDSKVKHALTGGEYAKRRDSCQAASAVLGKSLRDASLEELEGCRERMTSEQYRRARHVISEIQRTAQAAKLLQKGDFRGLGELMNASHASLRDDFEVSCPELDKLTQLSLESGAYGSRLTGAGFGGCTVTLVEEKLLPAVMDNIKSNYKGQACFYICEPSAGAQYGCLSSLTSVKNS